jgi:hypothetical protein
MLAIIQFFPSPLQTHSPLVLFVCEICYLTVREDHRLRVSKNMVLRIFRPKREGIAEGWGNYIIRAQ